MSASRTDLPLPVFPTTAVWALSDPGAFIAHENLMPRRVVAISSAGPPKRQSASGTVTVESVTTPTTLKLPDGSGPPPPLPPGVAYAGKEASPFFTLGKPASKGLQMQAEAGMPDGIAAEVKGAVKFGRNEPVTVTAKPGDRFTFAVMFGQSNDLFYAPKGGSMALFDKAGRPILGDRTAEVALYDAGTEVNQVPGVGPDQGPRQKTWRQGELEHGTVWPVRDAWT